MTMDIFNARIQRVHKEPDADPLAKGETEAKRWGNHLTVLTGQVKQAVVGYNGLLKNAKKTYVGAFEFYLKGGVALLEAKEVCQHGSWGDFLKEAGITERTAQNMMRLARAGMKPETVADLGGVKAALQSLATPKPADPPESDPEDWRGCVPEDPPEDDSGATEDDSGATGAEAPDPPQTRQRTPERTRARGLTIDGRTVPFTADKAALDAAIAELTDEEHRAAFLAFDRARNKRRYHGDPEHREAKCAAQRKRDRAAAAGM